MKQLAVIFLFAVLASHVNSADLPFRPIDIRGAYLELEEQVGGMIEMADPTSYQGMRRICDSAGYIHATNAIPFLFSNLEFGYETYSFHRRRSKMMLVGTRSFFPLPPSVAVGALSNIPVEWGEYLSLVENREISQRRAECIAWLGLRNFPDRFTSRFVNEAASTNLWWACISNQYSVVEDNPGWRHSEMHATADRSLVSTYDLMETRLQALALFACMEQNATNLLDVVSTYRFIHAPIPETVSTNAFFQATIGDN